MTDTAVRPAEVPGAAPEHPLDPATGAEYLAGREILVGAGLLGDTARFAYYGLDEPPKGVVLAGAAGRRPDRRLRAFLIDVATGRSADVVVSLGEGRVVSQRVLDPAADGQVPIFSEEFGVVEEVVRADPGWQAAMARRGLTDMTKVRVCPQTAGAFGQGDDDRRRFVRVLAFRQEREHDYVWAHPIDGVTAYVDLVERRVFRVVDEFERPVPDESGDYDDPAVRGPLREGLRPIEIIQPEGPSFTLDGRRLSWQGWSMRVGFDAREGLVLHQIGLDDAGRARPVIYRASIPELVVPYGDPRFRWWQTYFDCGEYLLGKWTNSLEQGCDCLGEIAYLDATVTDDLGAPQVIRNAICIHEEDFGILWKHTDVFNGSAQTRRQRRLVVSSWATVGNYDYGFYWYFYLDGTIEHEVKMSGALFTAAYPGGDDPHSAEVAPGLGGPVHQHLFSARLDMTVDGVANAVEEVDLHGLEAGPGNPYGNAIARTVTRLRSEQQARRRCDTSRGRTWRVLSTERTNRYGTPVSYTLYPDAAPVLLAGPSSSVHRRAGFATSHLWVTRYDPAQRYPAGDLVNQHPGGAGLPAFIAGDRDIDGADIVVWHTFGPTHFPRPEDWPVMPVARCGFTLKPTGFFDRNPALGVPPPAGHAATARVAEPGAAAIRPARPGDVAAIHRLVRELADYERSLDQVAGTEDDLRRSLFGRPPAVFAHVAEHEGAVAGFALWFLSYSTWTGRHGIYLEDLYVTPALRRHGYGRALLAELARICVDRGYGRLEWSVLDWNAPAIAFYASLGAAAMDSWTVHRLAGPALLALVSGAPGQLPRAAPPR